MKGPSWPGHQLSLPGELGTARYGHRREGPRPTLVEWEGMGAGAAWMPPDLPMKVVQESGVAQMLLLITETSQSNSLLVCAGRSRLG